MSWVGLLLVGVAVLDLGRSLRLHVPAAAAAGAGVVVVLGLVAGLRDLGEVLGLLVVAALVVTWGVLLASGERAGQVTRRSAGLPLAVLGGGVLLGLVLAPLAPEASGWWARWLAASPYDALASIDPSRALLLLGVLVAQLSTGNVVVRLVLTVTDTADPADVDSGEHPAQRLKGGRLLGPMERLVILGLGLAGQLTAASIVIAAKGLLRWPELRSRPEQEWIHRLTEYFLVGSFVSWLLALGGLALVAT